MIDTLLGYVAPHHCCSCGKTGMILCDNCKYDITSRDFTCCVACGRLTGVRLICRQCRVPYERAWCVGERSETLQRLIGDFKFENAYDAYRPLGELLLAILDELPPETVVVPVPTVASHIRQRGYDHMQLIAGYIAARRQLKVAPLVVRTTSTKQRDAGRAQRIAQAQAAFAVRGPVDPAVPYLLVDDVVTTGATMRYAARALRRAGARHVWIAAIARQPL